jgi:hypothetical protein
MLRIHWLAVTDTPSALCILGRPTCVAAMSMAQVESPAAAASTAKRLADASISSAIFGFPAAFVVVITRSTRDSARSKVTVTSCDCHLAPRA